MAARVVTDSVSDISPAVAGELGIAVVPLNVVFGTETYQDGIDITTDEFYARLPGANPLPKTSTPTPQSFTAVYDRLADETDEILVITIGRKLSATGQAAIDGRLLMTKKNCRVEIVVSENAMMAEGLLVVAAAKAARSGMPLDDLVDLTRHNMARVGLRIAFDTLDYLKRGGRIGKAQALIGSVMGINPILGIRDGEVYPFHRALSRAKAIDYLYDFAAGFEHIEEMAVEDATTPDETDALVRRLGNLFPADKILRTRVSPVIGTNVGPRAIGLAVLGD